MYAVPALCLLLSSAIVALMPAGALAQSAAQSPVRVIVPVPPGGTSDVVARLLAQRLGSELGRTVIVDNRVGATGRVAVAALRSAAPDGRTLLFTPMVVPVIGPLVFRNKSYDPAVDFAPVAQVSTYESFAFAVTPDHPARDLASFVDWAKDRSTAANVSNPGAGSLPHLLAVRLTQVAGIDVTHVPHQGITSLLTNLMSGEVHAGVASVPDLLESHRAGRIRILAISGAARSIVLPEVPTFREQGYPAILGTAWHGVYAPASTAPATIDQLSKAIVVSARSAEFRRALTALGLEATGTTPQALGAIMEADAGYWRPIVEASGFSVE